MQENSLDTKLVNDAKNGNERAIDKLIRMTYSVAKKKLDSMLLFNHPDYEDIVQESVIKSFFGISSLKNTESYWAWTNKITLTTALTYLRKERKTEPLDEHGLKHGFSYTPDPLEGELEKELAGKIENSINRLSGVFKETFTLSLRYGLGTDVIRYLQIPGGTYYRRIQQARKNIRGCLAKAF